MSTCRRPALDFLRDLAMLAVMLIHVTSTYIAAESHVTFLGMNLALFLNQASRFSVPLFLFLSGYSLGIGADDLQSLLKAAGQPRAGTLSGLGAGL